MTTRAISAAPEPAAARVIGVRYQMKTAVAAFIGMAIPTSSARKRWLSPPRGPNRARAGTAPARSEEHTSELQSLMRISYAVFCLKKKKKKTKKNEEEHTT